MNASSALQATTLGLFLALAAGCAPTAPRAQAQSPAPASALDTSSAGVVAESASPAMAPDDYDWTMTDSKPRAAKSEAPAADLKPSQATSGQSILKSNE